jgi:hypothetical protein
MSQTQTQILLKADRLATDLAGGAVRVEKNVLLSMVAEFMSDPQGDVERLRQTLKLLKAGSGGHLKRTANYAQQVETVVDGLEETLADGDLTPGDLKSLLGWTARLLLVQADAAPRFEDTQRAGPPPRKAPPKPNSSKTFGGMGAKNQSTLERLKEKLKNGDEGDS